MVDLTPHQPAAPLRWPDAVLDLPDLFPSLEAPTYLVGGAVRDALLGRPVKDIDLVTGGSGLKLARQLANRLGGAFYPLDPVRDVGRALVTAPHGTQLVLDVARFRGPDLAADLLDRDFTINAMAVDLAGDLNFVIDPLGGAQDAYNRLIRRCNPDAIQSDPIRALRAVRQSVQLQMRIEPETLRDVRAVASRLTEVSPERVRDEFFKMLALPDPAQALRVADALGLLAHVLPPLVPLHGLKQDAPHVFDVWTHTLAVVEHFASIVTTISPARTDSTAAQFAYGMVVMALDRFRPQLQAHLATMWPDERSHRALLMLAALLHDAGKAETDFAPETGYRRFSGHADVGARIAEEVALNLRLSNAERARLDAIVRHHMRVLWLEDPSPRAIHRYWRATGEAGVDVCLLALADHLGTVGMNFDQDRWIAFLERVRVLLQAYYEQHARLVDPPVLVDGNRLMREFDLRPGPVVGELLDLIREAQAVGEVATADEALALARDYLDKRATATS